MYFANLNAYFYIEYEKNTATKKNTVRMTKHTCVFFSPIHSNELEFICCMDYDKSWF